MRIWLDKLAMGARGLTVQDIEDAIRRQNVELPSGRIESENREFTVRTDSGLKTADEFRRIVLIEDDDYLVRLGEVAHIEIAAEDDRSELRANGRNAIGLGIVKQSKANTLAVADGIKAAIDAGVTAVIQPGGSIRDDEVVAAANEAGIAMVLTGHRHFRH